MVLLKFIHLFKSYFLCHIDREGEGKGRRVNRRRSKMEKLRDSNTIFVSKLSSQNLHLRGGDSNE